MAKTAKRQNNHHLFWPRREYTHDLERRFRDLPCLQTSIDVEVHALLHRLYPPPHKPSEEQMEWLIQRHDTEQCGCYEPARTVQASIFDY